MCKGFVSSRPCGEISFQIMLNLQFEWFYCGSVEIVSINAFKKNSHPELDSGSHTNKLGYSIRYEIPDQVRNDESLINKNRV